MFGLTLKEAKKGFFDRAKVQRAADKATRDVLSRFGSFVRETAKRSMRRAPAPYGKVIRDRQGKPLRDPSGKIRVRLYFKYSAPGSPPFYRSGLLKKFIFFSYDTGRKSVVIGPTKLDGWQNSTIPALHEYGGTVAYTGKKGGRVVKKYPKRPYMQPAFDKELVTLPDLWRGSVKG